MSKRDRNLPLYADPVFRKVCELEERILALHELAHAINVMAYGQVADTPEWSPVIYLSRQIMERLERVEKTRCKLSGLTHPNRAAAEAAGGWKAWRKRLSQEARQAAATA